jgi:dipeptidyl aminopeptidase/acylaminoacyl peptidase
MILAVSAPSLAQTLAFSVRDDIEMARFSDITAEDGNEGIVKATPDGEYFAVVTTRGLLGVDLIESDINLFSRREIESYLSSAPMHPSPQPRVIAHIRSYPHHTEPTPYAPVILDLRWAPDQRHLFFRAENLRGNYQLYEVGVDGSVMHALTSPDRDVDQWDMAADAVVYSFSKPDEERPQPSLRNPDAMVITGQKLQSVLFPGGLRGMNGEEFSLAVMVKRAGLWQSRTVPRYSTQNNRFLSFLYPFVLSPKGDKLITLTPVTMIPLNWSRYEPASGYGALRFGDYDAARTSAESPLRPMRYSVIDLSTGAARPLNAPNARVLGYVENNRAAWSSDQRRVLITNSFMPLPEDAALATTVQLPCAVAAADLAALTEDCLFPMDARTTGRTRVLDAVFGADRNAVSILLEDGSGETSLESYRFENDAWHHVSSRRTKKVDLRHPEAGQRKEHRDLKLLVKEDLNTPPALWAEVPSAQISRQLWDPNPQLAQVQFGHAQEYHWKDRTGYEWSGALVKPVGFVVGKQYPFVLQMYSFYRNRFLTDGTDPTAFAARHLASVGFVVLQIQKKRDTLTDSDPKDALEGYRSAVAALTQDGLIDRSRGGVVGFSWTCWYAENALVRDPALFAAATIADGLDNGYMQYRLFGEGSYSLRHQMEMIYGSSPSGPGLKNWVERAPGFHLDQIHTPLRIEAITPSSVLAEWELYSSLRMQGKPVDLIYFPQGTHIHQKPLERLESQQGNVDWFRFWLQGYKDPDPSKRDQYLRWELLKQSSTR